MDWCSCGRRTNNGALYCSPDCYFSETMGTRSHRGHVAAGPTSGQQHGMHKKKPVQYLGEDGSTPTTCTATTAKHARYRPPLLPTMLLGHDHHHHYTCHTSTTPSLFAPTTTPLFPIDLRAATTSTGPSTRRPSSNSSGTTGSGSGTGVTRDNNCNYVNNDIGLHRSTSTPSLLSSSTGTATATPTQCLSRAVSPSIAIERCTKSQRSAMDDDRGR